MWNCGCVFWLVCVGEMFFYGESYSVLWLVLKVCLVYCIFIWCGDILFWRFIGLLVKLFWWLLGCVVLWVKFGYVWFWLCYLMDWFVDRMLICWFGLKLCCVVCKRMDWFLWLFLFVSCDIFVSLWMDYRVCNFIISFVLDCW